MKKKIIITVIIAAVLAIGGITAAVILSGGASVSVAASDMLQLADRYLSELNYEQAIVEFQKVLTIDPKNVEAYLGIAGAYVELGDIDKAVEVLREGLEATGDSRIREMSDRLDNGNGGESGESTTTEAEPVFGSMGSVVILGVEYDVATTTTLELPQSEITDEDLKKIAQLTNLGWLDLYDNQISDIAPLEKLTNLTGLILGYNQISDITTVEKLTNLSYLDLSGNLNIDIAPLEKLTNLMYLYLLDNPIIDINPLKQLTNLKELHLGGNEISDITPLMELANLDFLYLRGNLISEADINTLIDRLPNCDIDYR